MRRGALHGGRDRGGLGDIAGQRERRLRLRDPAIAVVEQRAIDIQQGDAPALGQEASRGGEPDAARRRR